MAVVFSTECVTYDAHYNTITVSCDMDLPQIDQVLNDESLLKKDTDGVWILNATIKVNPMFGGVLVAS
jgi:hypothetical protein